jgi:hypothetical protein
MIEREIGTPENRYNVKSELEQIAKKPDSLLDAVAKFPFDPYEYGLVGEVEPKYIIAVVQEILGQINENDCLSEKDYTTMLATIKAMAVIRMIIAKENGEKNRDREVTSAPAAWEIEKTSTPEALMAQEHMWIRSTISIMKRRRSACADCINRSCPKRK